MTHSIDIAAPPHIVFKWITEPDKLTQWIGVLESDELIERKEGEIGTRFRQTFNEGGRRFTMDGQVTQWEQDRAVSVLMTSGMMDLAIDQDLEPIPTGTRLSQRTNLRFKGVMKILGGLMSLLSGKKGQQKMEADFAKLKGFCEASATEANRTAV